MTNKLDIDYFSKKLKRIVRDLRLYSSDELCRDLLMYAKTADSQEYNKRTHHNDWNFDMEAAPKDGTRILIYDNFDVFICSWYEYNKNRIGWFNNDYDIDEEPVFYVPTAWQHTQLPSKQEKEME